MRLLNQPLPKVQASRGDRFSVDINACNVASFHELAAPSAVGINRLQMAQDLVHRGNEK